MQRIFAVLGGTAYTEVNAPARPALHSTSAQPAPVPVTKAGAARGL